MDSNKFMNLIKAIDRCAYNEEQKQEALSKLEELDTKITKVISTLIYNREWGKEISVLTMPSIDLNFKFYKE